MQAHEGMHAQESVSSLRGKLRRSVGIANIPV